MKDLYWKVPLELGQDVVTDDGFTGKITMIDSRGIKVKYHTSLKILKAFKRKSFEWYQFKNLQLIL